MTKLLRRAALGAAALSAAAAAVAPAASAEGRDGLDAIGLAGTGTVLVAFGTNEPENAVEIGEVTGLAADTRLIGIDYRVQDNRLYGVGNAGGIYRVDEGTAAARPIGQLTVALSGTFFGVDFNPAEGFLRIVSDTGRSYRQPFAGNEPAGATQTDGNLNRGGQGTLQITPATGVTAAAYLNNDRDPDTGTILGVINTQEDRGAVVFPERSGTMRGIGALGALYEVSGDTGLDVYSRSNHDDVRDDDAFATVRIATEYRLLKVDLTDSQFRDKGAFPTDVLDLAIHPEQYSEDA